MKKKIVGYSFLFIPVTIILVTSFYPMIMSFFTSLQSGMGNNLEFVGLNNYLRLFQDPVFKTALFNTVLYLLIQVPLMIFLALGLATLLNSSKIKYKGIFRTIIFLPCITSLIAYSVVFKSLFAPAGLINEFLLFINIIQEPIMWITDPFWSKVAIIISITWRWTGYNMIFYLAGLQNIDPSVYEAAYLDGANAWQKFKNITVPLLKPIILFTTIMSTNGTLQLFDEVVSLTNGGPGNSTLTISQYIYNLCFKYSPDFGYAATVSYVILFIVSVLAFIQIKLSGEKNVKKNI